MNELQIFNNEQFGEMRTVITQGMVYFCLADLCKALGIDNSRQAKARLKHDGVISNDIIDSLGRKQTANFINESNMYKLIFQSRKESAENFTDWVTSEVLPSIRKHGMYATDELLDNPDLLIQVATALKEERIKTKQLETEVKVKDQQISELQPKATYYDLVLQCPTLISMTEISKDYGKSASWMNKKLHELGVQFCQSGIWFLYQKYSEYGYTKTKTHNYADSSGEQQSKTHMYWTQKGRLFIYETLKDIGLVPLIEREGD